jgi:hypothetical protein
MTVSGGVAARLDREHAHHEMGRSVLGPDGDPSRDPGCGRIIDGLGFEVFIGHDLHEDPSSDRR